MDSEIGVRWLPVVMLVAITWACGPNAAPITLEAQGTPTPVVWKIEPTPTAVAARTPTAAPMAPPARPAAPPTPPAAPTPTGGSRVAPTVVPPPYSLTATPARTPLPAGSGGQPAAPVPTIGPVSPPLAAPPTPGPVLCQFSDRTVSVPQYSTPVAPTGLTAYASGDPLPGLHLELRLPRTTFVAGAVILPEVAVRNTGTSDAGVYMNNVVALPQNGPADPRSLPLFGGGPMPGVRPPLTMPPGQTRTFPPPAVQLPFDSSHAVQVHASVAVGATTLTADVPLKLTATGPAQQLKIELQADRKQWCARATDSDGRTPSGPLLMVMTGRAVNTSQQTPVIQYPGRRIDDGIGIRRGREL